MIGPAGRMLQGVRTIRFRIAFVYAVAIVVLAAAGLAAVNWTLERSLKDPFVAVEAEKAGEIAGADGSPRPLATGEVTTLKTFEQKVNAHAIKILGQFSVAILVFLAACGFVVAWLLAGRALRPIGAIATAAHEIEATDLSRRIALEGPRDELRSLADTFDALLARLERAFESERRFIADASHELRNPLSIISANVAELEAQRERSPELAEEITAIRRATDRMARLLDDLVLVARAQSPTSDVGSVDVAALLRELADDYTHVAAGPGLSVELAVAPGLVISGDRAALERAVTNLVDNALRYAPEGTAVGIRAGREDGWAWITIRDEGPGIPEAERSLVFTRRWRRADGSAGVGLGLAIVRQIVQAHGGEVRVDDASSSGGALFTLWLPVEERGRPPQRPPAQATSAA